MPDDIEQPFESIESAHEFMGLLAASIEEALRQVQDDSQAALGDRQERRVEALNLAIYKLKLLETHVQKSRRILNDLRAVRRLLFSERSTFV